MPSIHRRKYYRKTVCLRWHIIIIISRKEILLCKMVLQEFFSKYFERFIRDVIIIIIKIKKKKKKEEKK